MRVKSRADIDLDRAIVRGLLRRRPTADFQSQPLGTLDGFAVLHLAAQADRILISHDVSTMPGAFAEYRQAAPSPGVLLVLWPLAETIENLVLIRELSAAEEWRDRICYLPTLSDLRIP